MSCLWWSFSDSVRALCQGHTWPSTIHLQMDVLPSYPGRNWSVAERGLMLEITRLDGAPGSSGERETHMRGGNIPGTKHRSTGWQCFSTENTFITITIEKIALVLLLGFFLAEYWIQHYNFCCSEHALHFMDQKKMKRVPLQNCSYNLGVTDKAWWLGEGTSEAPSSAALLFV